MDMDMDPTCSFSIKVDKDSNVLLKVSKINCQYYVCGSLGVRVFLPTNIDTLALYIYLRIKFTHTNIDTHLVITNDYLIADEPMEMQKACEKNVITLIKRHIEIMELLN